MDCINCGKLMELPTANPFLCQACQRKRQEVQGVVEAVQSSGTLPDKDRTVHLAITALIEEFAVTPHDPKRLESLLHRVASIQGRLNYAETAIRAAWELSLGETGMSSQHIEDLKQQMRAAVGR